jgi:hypothetical protein
MAARSQLAHSPSRAERSTYSPSTAQHTILLPAVTAIFFNSRKPLFFKQFET